MAYHIIRQPRVLSKCKYLITFDSREHKLIDLLKKDSKERFFPNCLLGWQQLPIGDIIISKRIGSVNTNPVYIIERKDISDLIATIKDKERLHNLAELRISAMKTGASPIMLIEDANRIYQNAICGGDGIPKLSKKHYHSMMPVDSIWHFISSLSMTMPVLFTLKPSHTLRYLTTFIASTHESLKIQNKPRSVPSYVLGMDSQGKTMTVKSVPSIEDDNAPVIHVPITFVAKKHQPIEIQVNEEEEKFFREIHDNCFLVLWENSKKKQITAMSYTQTLEKYIFDSNLFCYFDITYLDRQQFNYIRTKGSGFVITNMDIFSIEKFSTYLLDLFNRGYLENTLRYGFFMTVCTGNKKAAYHIIYTAPIIISENSPKTMLTACGDTLISSTKNTFPFSQSQRCNYLGLLCAHYLSLNGIWRPELEKTFPTLCLSEPPHLIDMYLEFQTEESLEVLVSHIEDDTMKKKYLKGLKGIINRFDI